MTYTISDALTELDARFEPSVRHTFDQYSGLPCPLFVLIAMVHPTTGKRFDKPTPCPIMLAGHQMPSPRDILDAVKRKVLVTEAVAVFMAYPVQRGIKVRTELPTETHEWLLPVLRDPKQQDHLYLGKRIDFSHGVGAHAQLLDELDEFGGMFDNKVRAIAEA